MADKKMVYVRGALRSISSQRLQYKPYGYELSFDDSITEGISNIFVEMNIPASTVQEFGKDYIVIDLDGLNAILEVTADSLDKLDQKYKKSIGG